MAATVSVTIIVDVTVGLVAIAVWLFLAWANGKGSPLARVGAIIVCAFYTAVSIQGFTQGEAAYAPVALLIVSSAVVGIGIAATVLLLAKQSWPYYARTVAAR